MIKWSKLIISILICQLAGIVGSIFTIQSITTWYSTLAKPWFTPPGRLFGPVWIILYTLMGISLYLVIKNGINKKNKSAVTIFSIHLMLNAAWTIIFFGLKSPLFAFIEIIALLGSIVLTMNEFNKINKIASRILIPYLIWVTFASILNLSIMLMN